MRRRDIPTALIASVASSSWAGQPQPRACSSSGCPQTAAEMSAGIMPVDLSYAASPIDVRRYGIVPNNSEAAGANTRTLRALLNPGKPGPTGLLMFPNSSGADVYHFDGVIPIRDGIHIDLMGSTIRYSGRAAASDVDSGLFFALRDFSCANGSISVSVDTSAASSSGYAIKIGARGTESTYFTVYDSQLAVPLGNVTLRHLRITIANSGSNLRSGGAIALTGGLQNVVVENVTIDGNGTAGAGIAYEFGWATPGPTHLRQTSHAHNMRLSNVVVQNLDVTSGIGLILAGAYSCCVDGLYVAAAANVVNVTSGESLFYRPWSSADSAGVKHGMSLRNVVGQRLHSSGIALAGAQLASGGYLGATIKATARPETFAAETDLGDFSVEGFALDNSGNPGNGWGIQVTGAARVDIRNGSISGGFNRGIVCTDETMNFSIDAVRIFGCQQTGIQLDVGVAIWSPPRLKMGEIKNCYVAGNSRSKPGAFPAISLNNCQSVLICNNRLGQEAPFAGSAESTQGGAVLLGSTAHGVQCDANHVAVSGDSVAYHGTAEAQGNSIRSASGTTTTRGTWSK